MEIYKPTTNKELSRKKIEEYAKFEKIIRLGRQNPIWFIEEFYGIALMDYQKWMFMESWSTPFVLWLCSRGAGKTVLAAIFLQTKMVLIPDYRVYISTNSAAQSIEVFKKIEDIALQRIPSFRSCTDIFLHEVDKSGNTDTGFIHDPAGHHFRLYNNSELITLSTNVNTIRGKRGSVLYDETAWQSREQMVVTENFINVDSNFQLGVNDIGKINPVNMPLQLLYCSSAGDVSYPFYDKFKQFSMKMFEGDRNYFCCDLDAYTVMNNSSVNGVKIKSHLTEEQIQKSIEEDPELAERELFNKFRRGGGLNAVVPIECLIRNSKSRVPLLFNDDSEKKFIFCYDPARNFDGSVLSIFQLMYDDDKGYWLRLEWSRSMVDSDTKKKTPLPMNEQIQIIKEMMLAYNGDRAEEWDNIEFYIDSGAGGGGISAVADQLMEDWTDKAGIVHRGIIDPEHKQYESARKKYTNAVPIVHLIDPQGYKKIIYDSLAKMAKLNLIEFTDYDGKDYINIEDKHEGYKSYQLNFDERLALTENNLMKTEISYMCRYDNPNGGVQYDLSKEKKNTMHDDRSYTAAMAAYALAVQRREILLQRPKSTNDHSSLLSMARKPSIIRN